MTSPAIYTAIAQDIRTRGYSMVENLFPSPLLLSLYGQVKAADEAQFRLAGIGRDQLFQVDTSVRTDRILWLDEQDEDLSAYFRVMEDLRLALNRELLLGLFDYECHYAHYPANAFYKKHIDAFRGESNRRLSSVLYLNADWQPRDGGELVLYSEVGDQVLEKVVPTFGKLVLFLSEEFPHEVLPTRTSRYSLTGWFRVNAGFPGDSVGLALGT